MKKLFFIFVFLLFVSNVSFSAEIKFIVMQDDKGAAEKFQPLLQYLKKNGVEANLIGAPDYRTAANMFLEKKGDAMFSGSGVGGILIIKDLAYPLVRPVTKEGTSTYRAVIIGPKGSPKFDGTAKFFEGKKVIFSALASSGEVFYYSLQNIKKVNATPIIAGSHGAAIDALSRGAANFAIVKNLVWEKNKDKFPMLEKIGEDVAENPDMTLMISKHADKAKMLKVSELLLNISKDSSAEAEAVKEKMGVKEFIKTTQADFKHTIQLLKKAGADKNFNFKF